MHLTLNDTYLVYEAGNPVPKIINYTQADLDEIAAAVAEASSPAALKARAATRRYAREIGGIEAAGIVIDTSRESQAMIAGAHAYVQATPAATVEFKAASGWVTLDAATVTTIALAVASHVQACFAAEKAADEAIDAGTITTAAEVDAAIAA